ncbi:hypothetical protein AKJ51_04890 [candidate division MSBL1 archaeon SCGC-AAA382A20]|uniref:Uncharacterized protein n=1 Tax=candidate division MSBL1 archaeon SCGC-AAA382A20 TaxID=1698280 RepID=A0A133VGW1_9EURY|nr:hypothetical protein AKJ51_04890 [candidate division MSBL1 archaeon SCGC-AAA382A20]
MSLASGKVIGVITSKLASVVSEEGLEVPQNVNYAVRTAYVRALNESLPKKQNYPLINTKKLNFIKLIPKIKDSIVQVIVRKQ